MGTEKDVVAGIDSSTTATKAIGWRRDGSVAGAGRCPIPLANPGDSRYEQNPDDWWRAACTALRQLAAQAPAERIAAVAVSNQRETFVPLDAKGEPVRPAIVWLDQRCGEEVGWLTGKVGAEAIHRISGKPPDMAPVAYRIAWMLRHEPELLRSTAMFADVHAYLVWRLTGLWQTSWASADPLGLFDMRKKAWSSEILRAVEVQAEQLPALVAPCTVIGTVTELAAAETGLLPGTPVVAGGGDGQAAGLGVNALTPSRAYLNLGTAVVSGTYSTEYCTGTAWRTMGSCSGEGYYCETSLRAGTFLVEWFVRQVCQAAEEDKAIYNRLEAEAAQVPIGSGGLLAVPYWGAVMTPYWDPQARGCFVGLTGSHRIGHLYRSLLEGIALEQALVSGMIEEQTGVGIKEFIAIGGGAASDLWCQIVADASGKTVRRSETVEASSLGAAMCAAVGAGWFRGAAEAARSMAGAITRETEPAPENAARYAELMGIYREVYPQLRGTFKKLSGFASQDLPAPSSSR
jgi:sugar (pentulose or hexulose) kinase